ncbi:MAG: hypothetical protein HQL38_14025 [Alphaproteobacteria bacterium]|nr:hypothetical protein [Alphaproteobacteria bacterium]
MRPDQPKNQRMPAPRDKMVILIEEMPEDFVAALREPYFDAEQAALDHLMDEE